MPKLIAQTGEVKSPILFDRYLLFAVLGILAVGLVMVASASMAVSEQQFNTPFHFLFRQLFFLLISGVAVIIILKVPVEKWEELGPPLFLFALVLLVFVLVPGIGRVVNGSRRWIGVGPLGLQVSEFAKFAIILFMAGYLVRRQEEVRTQLRGFIKPMFLLGIVAILLLLQPDFGATSVIVVTVMGMMFLAGVKLRQYIALLILVVGAMALLAISAPYRMQRLTTFLNPWAHPFSSGYQLTQSLIAFGRGGWLGVGLGNSVQKLFYLPEAHTDFLFAVLAEELGLLGVFAIIALYALLIFRAMVIGRKTQLRGRAFSAYVAYGIGMWLSLQAVINMGVNSGILPTKGLTLPLMSYGGSSLLIDCCAIGLLFRIDYEARLSLLGFSSLIKKHKW
jgi:cell division protein FtsW